jgi:hypothetical protein
MKGERIGRAQFTERPLDHAGWDRTRVEFSALVEVIKTSENCNQLTSWTVSILIVPLPILCGSHLLRTCWAEGGPLVPLWEVFPSLHKGGVVAPVTQTVSFFILNFVQFLWFLPQCKPALYCTAYFLGVFITSEDVRRMFGGRKTSWRTCQDV